jgi:signal transduction histidine kinase
VDVDPEYLCDEIPKAVAQSLEGIERVATIVRAMKEFSHPGVDDMHAIDLNRAVESTATVCRNEWKYVAELELELDANLPPVQCLAGEVNQVVLNMIVNAAHAIGDVVGDGARGKGRITIRTRAVAEQVEIEVEDTGKGMPENVRSRVFDPFFTTKGVGKGTGQGLSIAHNVIIKKHSGTIEVHSEEGVGTRFVIRIPIEQKVMEEAA